MQRCNETDCIVNAYGTLWINIIQFMNFGQIKKTESRFMNLRKDNQQ